MGKPSSPTPPNPIATGAAQTGTNVATGVANAYLNNVNQETPQGNLTYKPAQSYSWTDPATGLNYSIPTFTAQQTGPDPSSPFYPVYNNNVSTQYNASEAGKKLSYDVMNQFNQGGGFVNMGNAPTAGDPSAMARHYLSANYSFDPTGSQQRSLGDTGQQQMGFDATGMPIQSTLGGYGDITRSYGPTDNFSADRSRVEQALYDRVNPQLDIQRNQLEQRLADQGIRYGSDAYNNAMDNYFRQANDMRLAVTQQGGQEQQRMMDMAAQRAGFQNAAQQQAYQQALQSGQFANAAEAQAFAEAKARGDFANAAQAQNYQQALNTGNFYNTAQGQDFQQAAMRGQFYNAAAAQNAAKEQNFYNAMNTSRAQWLSEQYDQANQGINQISALLSGSQVSKPSFTGNSNYQIPTTDFAGLVNNNFSQQMDIYKQQSNSFNSLMGGIFGLLGSGVRASDERIKENVDKVGTVFAAGPDGEKPLPIYEYSYKNDPASTRHIGPMAQDVEKVDRGAVRSIGGVKHIDMTRMGSILRPVVLKKAA